MRQIRQNKSLYDNDFYEWSAVQADLLRKNNFEKADIENIIEEIESLGRRDKKSLKSEIKRLLHHMLKLTYAHEYKGNSNSWEASIKSAKDHINDLLDESPSLRNEIPAIMEISYEDALLLAIADCCHAEHLFPKKCPWPLEKLFGGEI
jgi:hypothetical protein